MRLEGKVVVVTGSTTGIGRAIAERCAREGALLVIHGRRRAAGEEVLDVLARISGDSRRAVLHVDDLEDPDCGTRIVTAAVAAFSRLDGLVNNAAAVVRSDLSSTTPELFARVMATNVRAPLLLIKAAFAELRKTGGSVLNIGSVNAHCGESGLLDYSISKGALMTLSRNLADAHAASGVRINHLNVGWVLTPNEDALQRGLGKSPGWADGLPAAVAPAGRLIAPAEIAAAAVYWLGDESRPINGSVVELEQFPVIGRNPNKD
jgi:NAD(P)-dependent dehydrogenase (short-subunit alcohol dehydrogenase family)